MPIGQGHMQAEGEGVEPSRLIARPLSRRLPSPVGLPFRIEAAVAGIEPASGRLTAAYPYQHGPHRKKVRTAGFEPAISCSRSTRNTRLSYILFAKSAQRELNPRFRLGKAAGCRYIMGANG
jgi:hypothetical protein